MTREKTHSSGTPLVRSQLDDTAWPRHRKVRLLDATMIGDREYPAGTEIEITSHANGHYDVKALA